MEIIKDEDNSMANDLAHMFQTMHMDAAAAAPTPTSELPSPPTSMPTDAESGTSTAVCKKGMVERTISTLAT